jgi:hypothetical protein
MTLKPHKRQLARNLSLKKMRDIAQYIGFLLNHRIQERNNIISWGKCDLTGSTCRTNGAVGLSLSFFYRFFH